MNRDTLIDNLVRDLSKAGYGVKSQVKERILAVIAADREELKREVVVLKEAYIEDYGRGLEATLAANEVLRAVLKMVDAAYEEE